MINSSSFVAFITGKYLKSADDPNNNAGKEFNYAVKNDVRNIIPVLLDERFLNPNDWKGAVGLSLGNALYIDFTSEEKIRQNFHRLCSRIEALKNRPKPSQVEV